MKIYFVLFLLFLFHCGTSKEIPKESIKVMTYNIRLDFEGDGADNWQHRKADLAEYIQSHQPDFIGVQEALFNQVTFLKETLKGYTYIGVGRDDGKNAGEFMAVFYKSKKWNLEEGSTFWLSESPSEPTKGWDAHCFRVCTYGVFKKKNGLSIALFNTHFDHAGETARKESVAVLKAQIDPFKNKYPCILIGDFNVEPKDSVYLALNDYLKDSRSLSPNILESFPGTFNAFKPSGTFDRRIDYAFVDHEKIRVKRYAVETPRTKAGRQLSDHFPVIVDLEIK